MSLTMTASSIALPVPQLATHSQIKPKRILNVCDSVKKGSKALL